MSTSGKTEKTFRHIKGVCTVIIDDKNRYLLVKYDKYKKWELVKEQIDLGESLMKTAKREIEEEIGVSNAEFIAKLPFKIDYTMKHENEVLRKVYSVLLFKVKEPEIKLEDKFSDYIFLDFDKAIEKVTWDEEEEAIRITEKYLQEDG